MEMQEIFVILHKWGIHTLGQLAALDKEQLGTRLGPEAVRMWERANGQSNRLLKLVGPPESFHFCEQAAVRTRFQDSAVDHRCRSSLPHAPYASGEF